MDVGLISKRHMMEDLGELAVLNIAFGLNISDNRSLIFVLPSKVISLAKSIDESEFFRSIGLASQLFGKYKQYM